MLLRDFIEELRKLEKEYGHLPILTELGDETIVGLYYDDDINFQCVRIKSVN